MSRRNSQSSSRKRTPRWARVASPGPGRVAAADRPRPGLTVWCGARNGLPPPASLEAPAGAGDPRHFERLLGRQRRQDRGQAARGERLAGARAGRSSAGCARRRPPPRARSGGGAGRAGRRGRGRRPEASAAGAAARGGSGVHSPAASSGTWPRLSSGDHLDPADQRRLGRRSRPARRPPRRPARAPPRRSPARPGSGAPSRPGPARRPSPAAAGAPTRAARMRPAGPPRSAGPGPGPALRRLAGARLATIRRSGKSKPQLASAARTLSRASLTAASGRPTTEKAGRPRCTSTSTRTGRAAMPSRVNVRAVASIAATLAGRDARVVRRFKIF